MKTYFYILFVTLFLAKLTLSQEIWINEFSYNCADSSEELMQGDEFVEIVAPVGTNMSQYGIVFFFFSDNAFYAYHYSELSGVITSVNSNNGKGFFIIKTNLSFRLENNTPIASEIVKQSVDSYLEDESTPSGILLVESATGVVLHGVVYEMPIYHPDPTEILTEKYVEIPWSITLPSKQLDIVRLPLRDGSESEPNGSISMIGTGFSRLWTTTNGDAPNISTPGALNYSQGALPVELSSFSASIYRNSIKLNWRTETEVNNYGFEVERKSVNGNWDKIDFVNGCGNSNSPKDYSYTDNNVKIGKYSYRLKQVDNDGTFEYSNIIEITFKNVEEYNLAQNYPNPFNPNTNISFVLPEAGNVKLTIYNLLGQAIKTLVNGFKESGLHNLSFDARDLNSGIYLYKLEANGYTQTRKMTLVK
jgi:hypothetical protein